VSSPIIFGDYIKLGAAREDRVYEELSNIDKVKTSLGDVRQSLTCFPSSAFVYISRVKVQVIASAEEGDNVTDVVCPFFTRDSCTGRYC